MCNKNFKNYLSFENILLAILIVFCFWGTSSVIGEIIYVTKIADYDTYTIECTLITNQKIIVTTKQIKGSTFDIFSGRGSYHLRSLPPLTCWFIGRHYYEVRAGVIDFRVVNVIE